MGLIDTLLSIGVLLMFFMIMYSRFKKQSLRETYDEFRELFQAKKENIEERIGEVRPPALRIR